MRMLSSNKDIIDVISHRNGHSEEYLLRFIDDHEYDRIKEMPGILCYPRGRRNSICCWISHILIRDISIIHILKEIKHLLPITFCSYQTKNQLI